MRRIRTYGLLALLVLAVLSPAVFAGLNDFSGDWRNTDSHTRGITRLQIQTSGSIMVHAWGACSPSDCDWGAVPAYAYAPDVSSSISSSARAITAEYTTGFSHTTLVITPSGSNRLTVQSFTRFTDGSGRSNYTNTYQFVRALAPVPTLLPAPQQISPPHNTTFEHYPRTTTLAWKPVPGAAGYTVEVDCYHCCQANKWCADLGRTWKLVPNLTSTSYTFDFVGAQPGRWRVWAVGPGGQEGQKSGWWEFRYTK